MKNLAVMALLAAFAAGCTVTSVEEQDYENEIQVIDKNDIQEPDERGKNDPEDPKAD